MTQFRKWSNEQTLFGFVLTTKKCFKGIEENSVKHCSCIIPKRKHCFISFFKKISANCALIFKKKTYIAETLKAKESRLKICTY